MTTKDMRAELRDVVRSIAELEATMKDLLFKREYSHLSYDEAQWVKDGLAECEAYRARSIRRKMELEDLLAERTRNGKTRSKPEAPRPEPKPRAARHTQERDRRARLLKRLRQQLAACLRACQVAVKLTGSCVEQHAEWMRVRETLKRVRLAA